MGRQAWVALRQLVSLLALTGCTAGHGPAASPTAASLPTSAAATAPLSLLLPSPVVATTDAGGMAARGAQAFRDWCNSCHPGGQEGNGPPLWGRGIALTPAQIRAGIRHTGDARERQRFAGLSEARLNEIIAYIEAQQRAHGQ